jgi:hypothetical protein
MSVKTIMLVCNAGMSTSMLVNKMNQVVEKENKEYTIFAVSTSRVQEEVGSKKIDMILLGPQIRYMEDSIKNQVGDVPVHVIDMLDYGTMNAGHVLQTVEDYLMKDDTDE